MLDSEGTAGRSPSCGQQERQVGALVNSVDKSGAWWAGGAEQSIAAAGGSGTSGPWSSRDMCQLAGQPLFSLPPPRNPQPKEASALPFCRQECGPKQNYPQISEFQQKRNSAA